MMASLSDSRGVQKAFFSFISHLWISAEKMVYGPHMVKGVSLYLYDAVNSYISILQSKKCGSKSDMWAVVWTDRQCFI